MDTFFIFIFLSSSANYVLADSGASGCGSHSLLTHNNGFIDSHADYDGTTTYLDNSQCSWRIHAPAGKVVRLSTSSFDLETDTSCDYDFLAVYDGRSNHANLIGKFCGNDVVEVVSSGRWLFVQFNSDDSDSNTGFHLTYHFQQASAGCGKTFYQCKTHKCIPRDFICDQDDDCGDNGDEQHCHYPTKVCKTTEFQCADSSCIPNQWFCDGKDDCGDHSDERKCGRQAGLSGCGGIAFQNGTSGVFSSTGYPDSDYHNNSDCHWDINVPQGKFIRLTFNKNFTLEKPKYVCTTDHLTVYDGKTDQFIGEFCGSHAPSPIIIPSNHGVVKFFSDAADEFQGFEIHWEAIDATAALAHPTHSTGRSHCDQFITGSNGGVLQSPNLPNGTYPINVTCVWRIFAPEGHSVKLHFTKFGLEHSHLCQYDRVQVYDGPSVDDGVLATMCGDGLPRDEISKSNSMMVVFGSDKIYTGIGFRAMYSIVQTQSNEVVTSQACTGKTPVLQGSRGNILSDGYDGVTSYPENMECKWRIHAPAGKVINLYINRLEIEEDADSGCSYDSLSVFDGSTAQGKLLDKMCGTVYPEKITSATNNMFLKLTTDQAIGGIGFNLTYIITDPPPKCHHHQFQCGNMKCVDASLLCNGKPDCTDGSDELVCANSPNCGVQAIKPNLHEVRVVGGREAVPNSWPWQVMIQMYNSSLECGGSIIHPQWIATASHCFEGDRRLKDFTIIAGKHHENLTDPHEQKRRVTKILMHEHYDPVIMDNDITLLKLNEPLQLNKFVSMVCLPEILVPDGTVCIATGWGDVNGTCCAGLLKQVHLPIVNHQKCNSTDYLNGEVYQHDICAGYDIGQRDTCQGDSGGPLVCKMNHKWTLQGITSWGYDCAQPKEPGVYTKVVSHIRWIQETIAFHMP